MKEQEREKRRQFFIEAAFSQLKVKDPGQLTVKDIAAEINVSVPSVYTYFPSKDDLYIEILRRDAESFVMFLDASDNDCSKTPEEKCSELMQYFMVRSEISSLMVYFIGKKRSLLPEQHRELKQIQDAYLKAFNAVRGDSTESVFNALFLMSLPALSKANEIESALAS